MNVETFEFRYGSNGLELTDKQKDDCRAYAVAELISLHRDEFNELSWKHTKQKLEIVKEQLRFFQSKEY